MRYLGPFPQNELCTPNPPKWSTQPLEAYDSHGVHLGEQRLDVCVWAEPDTSAPAFQANREAYRTGVSQTLPYSTMTCILGR
jgi:hypothetical protein